MLLEAMFHIASDNKILENVSGFLGVYFEELNNVSNLLYIYSFMENSFSLFSLMFFCFLKVCIVFFVTVESHILTIGCVHVVLLHIFYFMFWGYIKVLENFLTAKLVLDSAIFTSIDSKQ